MNLDNSLSQDSLKDCITKKLSMGSCIIMMLLYVRGVLAHQSSGNIPSGPFIMFFRMGHFCMKIGPFDFLCAILVSFQEPLI